MSRPRQPVFLERRAYRRRRVIDAARLLPIVGGLLFLIPMLWDSAPVAGAALGLRVLLLFAIWIVLIVAAGAVAARLSRLDAAPHRPPETPSGDGARRS